MPKKVERIEFRNGGEMIVGDLYRPAGRKPHPCVVMGNGFGMTRNSGLPRFAEHLRQAGLAVLLFDYRHLGESGGEPRQLIEPSRQIDDWHRAIAEARMTEWIDGERIGLWGYSMGAGHAVRVAAEDGRVKAIVAQSPMTDGLSAIRAADKAGLAKASAAAVRDQIAAVRGGNPVTIAAVAPPGEVGAMTRPGQHEAFEAVLEEGAPNEVCARAILRVGFMYPIFYAKDVICPALVCVGERDDVTPPGPGAKLGDWIPKGRVIRYDTDHFGIFGDHFDRASSDHAEFLTTHLA